LVYWNPLR
jgi:hypothetical protein